MAVSTISAWAPGGRRVCENGCEHDIRAGPRRQEGLREWRCIFTASPARVCLQLHIFPQPLLPEWVCSFIYSHSPSCQSGFAASYIPTAPPARVCLQRIRHEAASFMLDMKLQAPKPRAGPAGPAGQPARPTRPPAGQAGPARTARPRDDTHQCTRESDFFLRVARALVSAEAGFGGGRGRRPARPASTRSQNMDSDST